MTYVLFRTFKMPGVTAVCGTGHPHSPCLGPVSLMILRLEKSGWELNGSSAFPLQRCHKALTTGAVWDSQLWQAWKPRRIKSFDNWVRKPVLMRYRLEAFPYMIHSLILCGINHMRLVTASYLEKTGGLILPNLEGKERVRILFPLPIQFPVLVTQKHNALGHLVCPCVLECGNWPFTMPRAAKGDEKRVCRLGWAWLLCT